MKPTQYLAVDTETTGLDADKHSLLELAAIPLDDKLQKKAVEPFHVLIRPLPGRTIDRKAIDVNRHVWVYDEQSPEYKAALSYTASCGLFRGYVAQHFGANASWIILVGWNPSFDMGFLKRLYTYHDGYTDVPTDDVLKKAGWPFHYHTVDLIGVCRFLDIRAGRSRQSYRLEALARHYFPEETTKLATLHTATTDCEMQLRVLDAVEKDEGK
jgi:DNA polymerase III epsilon subunit-like protein